MIVLCPRDVHLAERGKLLVGDTFAGELAGQAFKTLANLEQVLHVLAGKLGGALICACRRHILHSKIVNCLPSLGETPWVPWPV